MWEENGKKGVSCCLVALVGIVFVIGMIALIIYSFFYAFFSAFNSAPADTPPETSTPPVQTTGDGTYHYPLSGAIVITSPFDLNRVVDEAYGGNAPHTGTDFQAASGTVVIAPREGVVRSTYTSYAGGITMVIDHGNGEETRYLHLSGYITSVGESVSQGQSIAYTGNSGAWTTGPHLHFEIRINGTPIDPMTVL